MNDPPYVGWRRIPGMEGRDEAKRNCNTARVGERFRAGGVFSEAGPAPGTGYGPHSPGGAQGGGGGHAAAYLGAEGDANGKCLVHYGSSRESDRPGKILQSNRIESD